MMRLPITAVCGIVPYLDTCDRAALLYTAKSCTVYRRPIYLAHGSMLLGRLIYERYDRVAMRNIHPRLMWYVAYHRLHYTPMDIPERKDIDDPCDEWFLSPEFTEQVYKYTNPTIFDLLNYGPNIIETVPYLSLSESPIKTVLSHWDTYIRRDIYIPSIIPALQLIKKRGMHVAYTTVWMHMAGMRPGDARRYINRICQYGVANSLPLIRPIDGIRETVLATLARYRVRPDLQRVCQN